MKGTTIEWADHTFNPWWGCVKVSPECDNCYAEAWALVQFPFPAWATRYSEVAVAAGAIADPFPED